VRVIAIVDVAIEAVRPMEPRSGTDEDAVHEPIGPIVAVGGGGGGRVVKISVGADRRDADANANRDLRRGVGGQSAHKQGADEADHTYQT
jgi:hypothetical protein